MTSKLCKKSEKTVSYMSLSCRTKDTFLLCVSYQGFRLNLGERSKMIIFGSLLKLAVGDWAKAKVGLSLKLNRQMKLSWSTSLMHTVFFTLFLEFKLANFGKPWVK